MPSAVVKAMLSENRNGAVLAPTLIEYATAFLSEYAAGDDEGSVRAAMPSGHEEWVATFDEAWASASEKAMPAFIRSRASVWAGKEAVMPTPGGAAGPPAGGKPVPPAPTGIATGKQTINPAGQSDKSIAEMMHGLNVSDHDVNKAINDIGAQKISGVRIVSLSLSLVSGHVHPMGDSADLAFGSDMRLCSLIRQQRKAGVPSLDDVLKGKSKRELALHYTRLAKEYNDRGMIEEATLISQFWAESASAFEGDDAGLFVYITEWNRTYPGRGIPKLLDTDLILRNRKLDGGGPSSAEVKELKEALRAATNKLNSAEEKQSSSLKRIQKLEAAASSDGASGGGEKKCFICGGNHLARNCPDKDKGKGKPKGKSKDDPIEVEE